MKQKLTARFIETRKPNPMKRLDFRDEVVPGLVLRVSTSGTKKRLGINVSNTTLLRWEARSRGW
ncbi:MAG: hypothetical protein L3J36_13220 [Rhodobacteraceae bacterium]|nr:hypothetical protein [Paracoccaceae bacterium]